MANSIRIILTLTFLVSLSWGLTGCATVDRIGAKMDMAANRLSEQGKPEYEGCIKAIKRVGPMIAMQFTDGKLFDVVDASPGLIPGDTVRIYKVENGYEARLWADTKVAPRISITTHTTSGS